MSMLDGMISLLGALESDRIAVHEERCVCVRHRNADCLRCAEACTTGAITYADNDLHIDASLCIGCGTCATACPTCAIELRSPSDSEIIKQAKKAIMATQGYPVFACSRALEACADKADGVPKDALPFDDSCIVTAPCLGRIDEALLCGMAAYGCSSCTLVCADCDTCEHHTGGHQVLDVIESTQGLLDAFGSTMDLELSDALPQRVMTASLPSGGVDRRGFFENIRDKTGRVAGNVAVGAATDVGLIEADVHPAYRHVDDKGTLSHFTPERRTRTFNYLTHIGQPVADEITSRVIGRVRIDTSLCDSCRMCATFCPTGALVKTEEGTDGFFGIKHRPSLCVQCRLCESICPTDALWVDDTVSADLFMGRKAECTRMEQPDWTPNKPDSLYTKIHSAIGNDIPMTSF